jgi:hypothetical protein
VCTGSGEQTLFLVRNNLRWPAACCFWTDISIWVLLKSLLREAKKSRAAQYGRKTEGWELRYIDVLLALLAPVIYFTSNWELCYGKNLPHSASMILCYFFVWFVQFLQIHTWTRSQNVAFAFILKILAFAFNAFAFI